MKIITKIDTLLEKKGIVSYIVALLIVTIPVLLLEFILFLIAMFM